MQYALPFTPKFLSVHTHGVMPDKKVFRQRFYDMTGATQKVIYFVLAAILNFTMSVYSYTTAAVSYVLKNNCHLLVRILCVVCV